MTFQTRFLTSVLRLSLALVLCSSALSAQEPEPAVDASARPAWLTRARTYLDKAQEARALGREAKAQRYLTAALKTLARAPKNADASELSRDVETFLTGLERRYDAAATQDGLEVSDQELAAAPDVDTPADVEDKIYSIPMDPENELVKKYVAVYTGKRREQMQDALERMSLYKDMIEKEIKKAGLPRELLYLPIAESEFYNFNASHAGAVGLWQFMPATGRGFGLKVNYWIDERRDPEKATRAALQYLKQLYTWFDDWHLALAAYNRGEYGIERDLKFTKSVDFTELSREKAIPKETEHYVPKFMACVLIGDNPQQYGFTVTKAAAPETDEVVLPKPMDIAIAAKCAGTTEETIRRLNPTLRAWCTPKTDEPFALKVPKGSGLRFQEQSAAIKDWTPSSGNVKYKVAKGDTLSQIAKKHKTTVSAIQSLNKIKNPKHIRPGQLLTIRQGR